MKFTPDQEKAIKAKPANIVVSAAAGSGKTQVLTTRIINRIKDRENPVSVDKFLIVTFTKAAAAEMRERISKSLRNAVEEAENEETAEYLTQQLSVLGSADICTIDSFCYDVLKQNFYKVGLPSDISIGDSGETGLLKIEALEETADSLYCALARFKGEVLSENNDENAQKAEVLFKDDKERETVLSGFEKLTQSYSSDKSDSDFSGQSLGGDYTTMISLVYNKACSAAFPEKWLDFAAECYAGEYTESIFYKKTVEECKCMMENVRKMVKFALQYSIERNIGYEKVLTEEYAVLCETEEIDQYENLREFLMTTPVFGKLSGKRRDCDEADAALVKTIRAQAKDTLNECMELLEASVEKCAELNEKMYPYIKALCFAAKLMGKIYFEKMVSRKILDFSSCEHLALEIICPDGENLSDVGKKLKEKYAEIYVDEMQDSNQLQDVLFSAISDNNTFMVGDVKQSIYGFRNAEPSIFMSKCDESSFDEDAVKRKIFLSKNFRSRRCVIDAVNAVFDIIMREDTCGIDYIKEHRLDFGADFIPEAENEEKCEISIVYAQGKKDDLILAEAAFTAQKIRQLIDSGKQVWDKDSGKMRNIVYSDIAVLTRSTKNIASVYEAVFAQMGVPLYYDGGKGFYTSGEVETVLELLKLIDNFENDVPLASCARGPMFMFDENELMKIRLCANGGFFEAFRAAAEEKSPIDERLRQKCVSFLRAVARWREISRFVTVEELLRRIYSETNITSLVLSFPDGQKRRANLELLLEKAEAFESSSFRGLFNFVNYVEKFRKSGGNDAEAKSLSEKMNVTRLMTIHKSKGLEFPVVFLVGCANELREGKAKPGGILLSTKMGISMNYTDAELRYRCETPMRSIAKRIETNESRAEEMRVLYVALTRAREKLYAVCSVKEGKGIADLPQYPVTRDEILGIKSYKGLMEMAVRNSRFWNIEEYEDAFEGEEIAAGGFDIPSFVENSEINKLLDYTYPYGFASVLPNKASVSMLKSAEINLMHENDGMLHSLRDISSKKVELKSPDFEEKTGSGTFFGSAHHKMLEHINFNGGCCKEQREELFQKGILTEEEYNVINDEKIDALLNSEIGQKMKKAKRIYREAPFVIEVPSSEILPDFPEEETICVQGVIDCFFEDEDGNIVLLDYKTDRYEKPQEIRERYFRQLIYYEKALQSKFNNKVIKKYLYLLHKNDIIEV